jgi:Flp pilus assembly protein TadG
MKFFLYENTRVAPRFPGIRNGSSEILIDDRGQTLVLVALSLAFLMGAMALVIDVGFVRFEQRQLQTAADSAAIAAGLELGDCTNTVCPKMTTAATTALKEDGITTSTITPSTNQCTVSSSGSLAMTINVAPCVLGSTANDPNYGNTSMVEVVLTEPQKTFFGAIIGVSTMNLVARAEAGDSFISDPGNGSCLWAGSILFNSNNSNFNLTSCGVYDNGNLTTNSGDTVTATSFLFNGTWSPDDCGPSGSSTACTWNIGGTNTGSPTKTTTSKPDPLANLTEPAQPATQQSGNLSINASAAGSPPTTLQPGYYGGGININSANTPQTNVVNLSPGLYYFNGSVNVGSGATLECTGCTGGQGVTLFFKSGNFQPNSSATVNLSAPSTGNTANMLIWQSNQFHNSAGMDLDASTTITLNGIIYLPDATLTLNSGSGTTINAGATSTAVDVQGLIVNSGVTFDLNGSTPLLPGGGKVLGAFALSE